MDENQSGKIKTSTIYTALRPPRVALFLNNQDKLWKKTLAHIFSLLPTFWGGDSFLLIPTDGKTIAPVFKELLKRYDPDFIFSYHKTFYDLRADDEEEFQRILDKQIENYFEDKVERKNDKAINQVRKSYEDQLLRMSFDSPINMSDEIKNFLLKDLSVFHYRDDIRDNKLDYSGKSSHLLPQLVEVIANSKELKDFKIIELNLKNHPIEYQLIGYGSVGKTEMLKIQIAEKIADLSKQLPKIAKFSPDDVNQTKRQIAYFKRMLNMKLEKFSKTDTSVMLKSFWNRRVDLDGYEFRSIFNKKKQSKKQTHYDFFTRTAFNRSNHGLSYFYKNADYIKRDGEAPFVIVGDSYDDYCLYYCLLRTRSKVYWMPYERFVREIKKISASSYSFQLIFEARSECQHGDSNKIYWTSLSLTEKKKKYFIKNIKKLDLIRSQGDKPLSDYFEFTTDPNLVITYMMRLYERRNYNNRSAYQFIGGKGINFIDTPKPKSFNAIDPLKHKWISEIQIIGNVYPSADFLSSLVFGQEGVNTFHLDTTSTRVSDTGIHYQCPSMGFISSSDEVTDKLVTPKVNLVPAEDIFTKLFSKGGYYIRPSDKGTYFSQVLQKTGGLEKLIGLIRSNWYSSMFDMYLDTKKTPNAGIFNEGDLIQGRKYIDFESFVNLFSKKSIAITKEELIQAIDNLIDLKLLYRGHIYKCGKCKNCDWYSLEQANDQYKCKRCNNIELVRESSYRPVGSSLPFEPTFFYKLDEVFYQFWSNNGELTALTLNKLKENSEGSLLFITETEFRKDPKKSRPDFEIDILAIVDGKLCFGEAKKDANGTEGNKLTVGQIRNLISFDKFLPLKQLVFTSLSGKWSDDVVKEFKKIEKESIFQLLKLTKGDF